MLREPPKSTTFRSDIANGFNEGRMQYSPSFFYRLQGKRRLLPQPCTNKKKTIDFSIVFVV